MQFIWIFILLNKNVPRHSMLKQALSTVSLNRSSTSSRSEAQVRPKKHDVLQKSLLLRRGPAELLNILGIKKYQTAWVMSRGMTLALLRDAVVGSLRGRGGHQLGVGRVLAGLHLGAPVQELEENLLRDGVLDAVAHSCEDNRTQVRTTNQHWVFSLPQTISLSKWICQLVHS